MLAGVIRNNAENALLSQEIIERIMTTFLGNSARFVEYLDEVEPFSESELAAFSIEAGLTGIRILRGAEDVHEPENWLPLSRSAICTDANGRLQHLPSLHLYYLAWPGTGGPGCVAVGLTSAHIEKLQDRVSLPQLMKTLSALPGIRYVRVESAPAADDGAVVKLGMEAGVRIATVRLPFGEESITVALHAAQFFYRVRQLWIEFALFSLILAGLGLFFSWILYRYQRGYLDHIRNVEREMARQREDAALGRAAAAITHEIRNPLNAISMGLQRLHLEVEDLEPEYQELIGNLLSAVRRTDGIVTDIRRYARPLSPKKKFFLMGKAAADILSLYRGRCEAQGIAVTVEIDSDDPIRADADLMAQAIENLIRNGIEAQPGGGDLIIRANRRGETVVLSVENGGFSLSEREADQMLEPYFTTKTRGTGLGLALVRRIVDVHGGKLEIEVMEPQKEKKRICFRIILPASPTEKEETIEDTDHR